MQKKSQKMFFLIYIMIVRIDENKAYRHSGLYTSGRGQLIIFFYHSNTNTNRVSDNQSYLWKKVFKYTKTLFFNCVLQNTAGHKGLTSPPKFSKHIIFQINIILGAIRCSNGPLLHDVWLSLSLLSLRQAIRVYGDRLAGLSHLKVTFVQHVLDSK